MEGKWLCGICVCLVLGILYAIAVNWATMKFLLILYLQIIFIDRLIDRLGPVDLMLLTLLLKLLDLNLKAIKGHTEFWGKPSLLYCTIYNTVEQCI